MEHLLNSKEEPSPAVLERAAQRAIERGHFDRAADLIRRGLSVDRHNLYLHASNAKLLHEQGEFTEAIKAYEKLIDEVAGNEHEVLELSQLDSKLERYRKHGGALPDYRRDERPLTGRPRRDERTPEYWLHLLTLDVKARWFEAALNGRSQSLPELVDQMLSRHRGAVTLSLAARMNAENVGDFSKAREFAAEAVERSVSDVESTIRSLNTFAGVLTAQAQAEQRMRLLERAKEKLAESLDLDDENSYTMDAMRTVCELLCEHECAQYYAEAVRRLRG